MSKSWEASHFTDVEPGEWIELATDTIHFEHCCDCQLRHIVEYRIVENKAGKSVIEKRFWRDSFATELRRRYDKLQRRKK